MPIQQIAHTSEDNSLKPTGSQNPLPIKGDSAQSGNSITPNDATVFSATKGIYVGVGGDVKVTMKGGSTITFVGLAPGVIHPISVTKVFATGTTALNIVGVY